MMQTEKLEPIHRLAEEIMRDDAAGKLPLHYTHDDIIAVTVVFSHIMGARFVQYLEKEKIGLGASRKLTQGLGAKISDTVMYATDVDIKIKEVI